MRKLILKLKQRRRKLRHISLLHETIAELNTGIVRDVISSDYQGDSLQNKAKLLLKYNRRLRLITY